MKPVAALCILCGWVYITSAYTNGSNLHADVGANGDSDCNDTGCKGRASGNEPQIQVSNNKNNGGGNASNSKDKLKKQSIPSNPYDQNNPYIQRNENVLYSFYRQDNPQTLPLPPKIQARQNNPAPYVLCWPFGPGDPRKAKPWPYPRTSFYSLINEAGLFQGNPNQKISKPCASNGEHCPAPTTKVISDPCAVTTHTGARSTSTKACRRLATKEAVVKI